MSSKTQLEGAQHEQSAVQLLENADLQIVARNFNSKLGELDIVACDRRSQPPRLHIVEVRYRRNDRFGGAAASVTRTKQTKVRRTAALFLQCNPVFRNCRCQFDVITVTGTHYPYQLCWIQSAF